MARTVGILVLGALLAHGRAVSAGETVPTAGPAPDVRSTAIGFSVGANSTVGLLGPTLTHAFGRHLQIEVGGGWDFWGSHLSLMPKVVLGTDRDRYVGGAGVSTTIPLRTGWCCNSTGSPTWLIVDAAGYEHRFASGLALGFALGLALGLGGGRICDYFDGCLASDFHDVAGAWKLQTRFELAYWF